MIVRNHLKNPQRQKGAVLVVSILLLTVLTLVSLSSITYTVIQEKTNANSFNSQLSFQASEASLRSAEQYIQEMTTRPITISSCNGDCNQIWQANALGNLFGGGLYEENWWARANTLTNEAWWNSMSHTMPAIKAPNGMTQTDSVSYVAEQPSFIAEEVAFIPDDLNPNTRAKGAGLNFYRITSRGTGGEQSAGGVNPAQTMLQSIYGKRFY